MREELHEEKTVMARCYCWKGGCHGWLRLMVDIYGWGWAAANLDQNQCCGRDSQLEAKLLMLKDGLLLLLAWLMLMVDRCCLLLKLEIVTTEITVAALVRVQIVVAGAEEVTSG